MTEHINDLDMELQKHKQLKDQCEQMLRQTKDEVKTVKQNITMAERSTSSKQTPSRGTLTSKTRSQQRLVGITPCLVLSR